MDVKDISTAIVFAALYAIGVVILAPISFGIYQVRLADALLPLSMLFGFPSAIGLSLGCFVANIYGGLGPVDVFGGSLANLVACGLAWRLAGNRGFKYRLLGAFLETLVITIIVGGYLSLIFDVPLEFGFIGVLVGSIISINVLGFIVEEVLRRNSAVMRFGYVS